MFFLFGNTCRMAHDLQHTSASDVQSHTTPTLAKDRLDAYLDALIDAEMDERADAPEPSSDEERGYLFDGDRRAYASRRKKRKFGGGHADDDEEGDMDIFFKCATCKKDLLKDKYAKRQLRKGKKRRCRACTANACGM